MERSFIKRNFTIYFIITLSYIIISGKLQAQNNNIWEKTSFGVKGGANVASLISSDNSRMSVRATYQIGFLAEYKINDKFSIQPELLYSRQGQNDRGEIEGDRYRNLLRLEYAALPIMVNYHLFDGVWAETGLQAAYLIRAESDEVLGIESSSYTVRDNFKNFDLLYNLGIKYKTDWGFFIGLRYSVGLNNILENQFQDSSSMRHSVYQFNFGYFF